MLKIFLIILCIFIILFLSNSSDKKEYFINPYSNKSVNLINSLNNSNEYRFNNNLDDCFDLNYLLNKSLNIAISFHNLNMNNYENSKKQVLFCNTNSNSTDVIFGELLNESLPYNNILINTGDNNEINDEWEIIKLDDMELPPLPKNVPPPKINKCGFLIRNVSIDRYLGYGNIINKINDYGIQNNIVDNDPSLNNKNIVFTGPPEYINYQYLWDINKVGCNIYNIRHIHSGKYLSSTKPNLSDDYVNENNDSENDENNINRYGEIFCNNQKYNWFIFPIKPITLAECEPLNVKCSKKYSKKYSNIGGEGNCCSKKLNTKLCLQGSNKHKEKKILDFPSAPWCGIKNVCN